MTSARWYAVIRFTGASLALVGLAVQFRGAIHDPEKTAADFFSEFTTQSNLLAATVLGASGWVLWTQREPGRRWDTIRGASVTYMALTGIVFYFLVAGTRETVGPSYYHAWASHILHRVMPLFLLADWLALPPVTRIPLRKALYWPVYPLVYCAYSLVRGPIVDWYPYNFLDPSEAGGADGVALYVLAITGGFLVFSAITIVLGNAARERWGRQAAPAGGLA